MDSPLGCPPRALVPQPPDLIRLQFYEMDNESLKPVHPGEILLEEFLKPMNLSQERFQVV